MKGLFQKHRVLGTGLFSLGLAVALAMPSLPSLAAEVGRVVVFSASWCADCRDIVPVIQDAAQELSIPVSVVDVDRQDSAKQAKSFGLAIPSTEPPQVYWVGEDHQILLFDGRGYDPTTPASKVKSQVSQKLLQR